MATFSGDAVAKRREVRLARVLIGRQQAQRKFRIADAEKHFIEGAIDVITAGTDFLDFLPMA
jgi:hypothetical protein